MSCKAKLASLIGLLRTIKSWLRNSCKRNDSEEEPLPLFNKNVYILLTNCLQELPSPCIKPKGVNEFSRQQVNSQQLDLLYSRQAAGNELTKDLTLPHRHFQCTLCYISLGLFSIHKFKVSCLKYPNICVHIYLIEILQGSRKDIEINVVQICC